MTDANMFQLLGKAFLTMPMRDGSDMQVPVTLLDVRYIFGRYDWLVKPAGGFGSTWVQESSLLGVTPTGEGAI